MKMVKLVAGLAIAIALAGCSKSGETAGTTKTTAGTPAEKASGGDGYTEVPNISGMQAKVPARLVPNGIGGAAGFHEKDGAPVSIQIMEVSAEELGHSMEDAKKSAEALLFKKWIKSEKAGEGWVLTYEGERLDDKKEPSYNFEVRTKVGAKTVKCFGNAESTADLDAAVEVCKSLKAS